MACSRSCGAPTVGDWQLLAARLTNEVLDLPSSKVNANSRKRLLKLVAGEARHLARIATGADAVADRRLRSSNLVYLGAMITALQDPGVSSASSVMVNASCGPEAELRAANLTSHRQLQEQNAQISAVCLYLGRPCWLLLFARRGSTHSSEHFLKVCDMRVKRLRAAAAAASRELRPDVIVLFIASGLDAHTVAALITRLQIRPPQTFQLDKHAMDATCKVNLHMRDDVEPGWTLVEMNGQMLRDSFAGKKEQEEEARRETPGLHDYDNGPIWLRLPLQYSGEAPENADGAVTIVSSPSLSIPTNESHWEATSPEFRPVRHLNLDTTVLVAMVSEISHGAAHEISALSNEELRIQFGNMWEFVRDQAASELLQPLVPELELHLAGMQLVVCSLVFKEFAAIINQTGGPMEKARSVRLLGRISVVPDEPSERVQGLRLSGRVKVRNKIVVGTGDTLHIPTLTANMSFVRAATQAGVLLSVIEHRPRALLRQ